MLELDISNQFKKDFKKIARMPVPDIVEVGYVIKQLLLETRLSDKYADHQLSGNWSGYRDCHIKPDLVIIYKINKPMLRLARIGSHSELFK